MKCWFFITMYFMVIVLNCVMERDIVVWYLSMLTFIDI